MMSPCPQSHLTLEPQYPTETWPVLEENQEQRGQPLHSHEPLQPSCGPQVDISRLGFLRICLESCIGLSSEWAYRDRGSGDSFFVARPWLCWYTGDASTPRAAH